MRIALLLTTLLPAIVHAQTNNGPDAPDVLIDYEPGTGFTFELSNPAGSNNAGENYTETILPPESSPDPVWRFQGYVIYQFAPGVVPSLAAVLDPDQARPVIIADKADDVDAVTHNVDPSGPDACVPMTWQLLNAGIPSPLTAYTDPFTLQPHLPDAEYCFLALAFAHNQYHVDPECEQIQQILQSQTSASGSVTPQCVTGNTVGIIEGEFAEIHIGPVPAHDMLRIAGEDTERYRMHCYSAVGALVVETSFTGSTELDVSRYPAGQYTLRVTDGRGRTALKHVMVGRD